MYSDLKIFLKKKMSMNMKMRINKNMKETIMMKRTITIKINQMFKFGIQTTIYQKAAQASSKKSISQINQKEDQK